MPSSHSNGVAARPLRQLPISRLVSFGNARFFYAYGNTPPVDYLEHVELVHKKIPQDLIFEPLMPPRDHNAHAKLLVLGVGDLRSALYTIWKMDLDLKTGVLTYPPKPGKLAVSFVMNDYEPAVQARNILILYLALAVGAESTNNEKQRQMLSAVWAIWYCHELLAEHTKLLLDAIAELLKAARNGIDGWKIAGPDYGDKLKRLINTVSFENEDAFTQIHGHWKRWQEWVEQCHKPLSEMRTERADYLTTHYGRLGSAHDFRSNRKMTFQSFNQLQLLLSMQVEEQNRGSFNFPMDRLEKVGEEYSDYLCCGGSPYAESVLMDDWKAPAGDASKTVNPTFYTQDVYSLHYGLHPYDNFRMSPNCTKSNFGDRANASQLPLAKFMVTSEKFTKKPALANSVQQFTIWFVAAAKLLSAPDTMQTAGAGGKIKVLQLQRVHFDFEFAIDDCCLFLQRENQRRRTSALPARLANGANNTPMTGNPDGFDAIFTSNLMDHVPFPDLLGLSAPLLGDYGVFVTSSLRYKAVSADANSYLTNITGVPVELFPLVLGLQPVGCEGKFSDPRFWPYPSGDHAWRLSSRNEGVRDTLFEERANTLLLLFKPLPATCLRWQLSDLSQQESLCRILAECCRINATACTHSREDMGTGRRSVSSFFIVLKWFVDRLLSVDGRQETLLNHQFWQPLVDAVRNSLACCFWEEIQAHAFAHGFHWHLTVDSDQCSMCDQTIESSIVVLEIDVNGINIAGALVAGNWCGVLVFSEDRSEAESNRASVVQRLEGRSERACSNRHHIFLVMDLLDPNPSGTPRNFPELFRMLERECKVRVLVRRALLTSRSFVEVFGVSRALKPTLQQGGVILRPLATAKFRDLRLLDPKEHYSDFLGESTFEERASHFCGAPLMQFTSKKFQVVRSGFTVGDFCDSPPIIGASSVTSKHPETNAIVDVMTSVLEFKFLAEISTPLSKKIFSLSQPKSNMLRLGFAGYGRLELNFPFSVNKNRVRLEMVRAGDADVDGTKAAATGMLVKARRVVTRNVDTDMARRMYFSNPENHIMFFNVDSRLKKGNSEVFKMYSGMMARLEEITTLKDEGSLSVPLRVIRTFKMILDNCDEHRYYQFALEGHNVHALGVVLATYFDLEKQSPAIDFMFCPLQKSWEPSYLGLVVRTFQEQYARDHADVATLDIEDEQEYNLLKAYFSFFAFRTRINPEKEPYFAKILQQKRQRQFYQRGLIYPLYINPEKILFVGGQRRPPNATQRLNERISLHGGGEGGQLNIANMMAALLSGGSTSGLLGLDGDASGNHEGGEEDLDFVDVDQCAVCNRPGTKRCSQCRSIRYCSVDCQRADWPSHRVICSG